MKRAHPRWSVVVVAQKGPYVLSVARGFNPRDVNLPGGDDETQDSTPEETAARELYEETGLRATALKPMATWEGDRGQVVYAFYVLSFTGRVRSSDEGKAFWTFPANLTRPSCEFAGHNKALLMMLKRVAA